ncbi:alcohol dehydrogenase GroES domain protein [Hyaloraphidium curvatum]|nr:alcohol dehydrogenase GroES domain protein [Hyaloraphidium curvatum]
MPFTVSAWAAPAASAPLAATTIERRDPRPTDIVIDILFAGICHSDIHQVRDEWGGSKFPMVPGHEIVGRVVRVGSEVKKFKAGDLAGIGCLVDSCRSCSQCKGGDEQFCEKGSAGTYNSFEMDKKTPTYGGYSTQITCDEAFCLRVPENLDLAGAAPLLCAGITTYSPLRQWNCKAGDKVGVVGLGGLGHMAVKIAAAMGAEVTMFSTTRAKQADAERLGAKSFVATTEKGAMDGLKGKFDLIIDTVSAEHDYGAYLALLKPKGTMILVGAPPTAVPFHAFTLIPGNRRLVGSMIGGLAETQEMLDFCGKHGIVSDVEVIPIEKVNEAYDRVVKSDVRYRFVIDISTLKKEED